MAMPDFQEVIDRLEKFYGPSLPPKVTDPLELIIYENIAYLVEDARREAVFVQLRKQVGLKPTDILSAPAEVLQEVAKPGGMNLEGRLDKLRTIARIVLGEFDGDLNQVLKLPLKQAMKALKKFPGIGDPGAEKILLFTKTHPILALESNGLRVLLRLGFDADHKNYTMAYRSAQEAVKTQLKLDCGWLIGAHQLLRRHGQELCRRTSPACGRCPLKVDCQFAQAAKR
jgi:endonuclease-3